MLSPYRGRLGGAATAKSRQNPDAAAAKTPGGDRARCSRLASFLASFARAVAPAAALGVLLFGAQPASALYIQQGAKLVANNGVGAPGQGRSVSISADGNTAIVGGYLDNSNTGAAWIYTRSNGVWTQGQKLIGTGPNGPANQGFSVAISADASTAIVGGYFDASGVGAVWVYTQSVVGEWSQQGQKLVGTGGVGTSEQGFSVALAADGNTAIVGGRDDNSITGAAWIFVRSVSGAWSQQGLKLIGSGASGVAAQGQSVALSADGNTALVGGNTDAGDVGAAWVYTRSVGVWNQQGPKLVGTGAAGISEQGQSVSLSSDGNTAILGGPADDDHIGAAWVFTRTGGVWSQQGDKLVGTVEVGLSQQGWSVALSGNANVALVGGYVDNSGIGAIWAFTQIGGAWVQQGSKFSGSVPAGGSQQGWSLSVSADGSTIITGGPNDNGSIGAAWVFRLDVADSHDFNADLMSDILWRDAAGDVAMWLMYNGQIGTTHSLGNISNTFSIIGQHDFNGDGFADLLWRDTSGNLYMWFMAGVTLNSSAGLGNVSTDWTVKGTGDMNGDGAGDLLWQDSAGDLAVWFMNGSQTLSSEALGTVNPATWSIVATNGTGAILWRDTSGNLALWQVSGANVRSTSLGSVPSNWQVLHLADFNGDGAPDLLFRDTVAGTVAIWFLNSSGNFQSSATVGAVPISTTWAIAATGDYNGDGMSDILWLDASGDVAIWFMNAATVTSSTGFGNVGTSWMVQDMNAE